MTLAIRYSTGICEDKSLKYYILAGTRNRIARLRRSLEYEDDLKLPMFPRRFAVKLDALDKLPKVKTALGLR